MSGRRGRDTQEEIAEAGECYQAVVSRLVENFMQTVLQNQVHKTAASHLSERREQAKRISAYWYSL